MHRLGIISCNGVLLISPDTLSLITPHPESYEVFNEFFTQKVNHIVQQNS